MIKGKVPMFLVRVQATSNQTLAIPRRIRHSGSTMQFCLQTFFRFATAALLALTINSVAHAQTSHLPGALANSRPVLYGEQAANYSQGFTSAAGNHRNLDAMYEANSRLPLGGFFAKDFTRTFTVLGGASFLSSDLTGVSSGGALPSPAVNFDDVFSDSFFTPIDISDLSIDGTEDLESVDTGYAISAAYGRRHNKRLRSEIEFAVRGNELNRFSPGFVSSRTDADIHAFSLLKNVLFDFPNRSFFTPYGGVGIGVSWINIEGQRTTFTDSTINTELSEGEAAFTYQAIGGVAAHLTQGMDFVVEYRFLGAGDVDLDSIGNLSYDTNNLFLGMKLEF